MADTQKQLGGSSIDLFERGLALPGAGSSEIAAATQAGIAGKGLERAADVRFGLASKELERLGAKEAERRGAYGQRFQTGSQQELIENQLRQQQAFGQDEQMNQIMAQLTGQQFGAGEQRKGQFAEILARMMATERGQEFDQDKFRREHPSGGQNFFNQLWGKTSFNVDPGSFVSAMSDRRLKKKIKRLDSALKKVLSLNGVSFKWKATNQDSAGVIAQDVQKVMPEAVNENNGFLMVNYGMLIPLLIEAVKELHAEVVKRKEPANAA